MLGMEGIDILAQVFQGWGPPLWPVYEHTSYAFSFVLGWFAMMRGWGIEFKGRH